MNLSHFTFLGGICLTSWVIVMVVIMGSPMTKWPLIAVRFFSVCSVLSLAAIWIGLVCKLIASIL